MHDDSKASKVDDGMHQTKDELCLDPGCRGTGALGGPGGVPGGVWAGAWARAWVGAGVRGPDRARGLSWAWGGG